MELLFAKRIRGKRLEKGLTQEQLAQAIQISPQAVSKWERGDGYPDITLLPRIANFFQISVDELIGNDEATRAEDADNFARLIKSFANDKIDVEVLRYHEYGKDKWAQCGMEYRMNDAHVTDEEYTQFIDVLKKNGISIIKT